MEIIFKSTLIQMTKVYAAGIYLLKDNKRNTGTRCEICSKLTIKIPVRQWRKAYFTPCSSASFFFLFANFEQENAGWVSMNGLTASTSTFEVKNIESIFLEWMNLSFLYWHLDWTSFRVHGSTLEYLKQFFLQL